MNSILEYLEDEPEAEKASDEGDPANQEYSFLEGICNKCLDTGFVHTVKNGVLGVAFMTVETNNQQTKKLMVCSHGRQADC